MALSWFSPSPAPLELSAKPSDLAAPGFCPPCSISWCRARTISGRLRERRVMPLVRTLPRALFGYQ